MTILNRINIWIRWFFVTAEINKIREYLIKNKIPIVIIGPTASGKSSLAVSLARALDGEIISLDSMQVYIGMDIGTGKITPEEKCGIPHHLIDVIHPDRVFSAGRFQNMAESAVSGIWKRGKIPVIVGGTGLYLRAFLKGLFPTPARSEVLRERISEWEKQEGLEGLYAFLNRIDPDSREFIKAGDRQRIHRALEIYLATGKTQSFMRSVDGFGSDRFNVIKIGLDFKSRDSLYKAIEKRVDAMFSAGWVEEVKSLLAEYSAELHPFRAIGYREIAEHLHGNKTLDETITVIKQKTRNYAKRQITWYKKEDAVKWFDAEKDKELVCEEVLQYILSHVNDEGDNSHDSRTD